MKAPTYQIQLASIIFNQNQSWQSESQPENSAQAETTTSAQQVIYHAYLLNNLNL